MPRRTLSQWLFGNGAAYTPANAQLDRLLRQTQLLNQKVNQVMATLDEILANARAMDTRLDSVRELIESLRREVNDVLSGARLPEAVQSKVDEIFNVMQANNAEVTQALQPPGAPPEIPTEPAPAPVEPAPPAPTDEPTPAPEADTPAPPQP